MLWSRSPCSSRPPDPDAGVVNQSTITEADVDFRSVGQPWWRLPHESSSNFTWLDQSSWWYFARTVTNSSDKVREIRGKQASNRKSLSVNISDLNRHYASISTDPNYTSPKIKLSVSMTMITMKHNDETHFSEYEVFTMLDKIKPTATGLD